MRYYLSVIFTLLLSSQAFAEGEARHCPQGFADLGNKHVSARINHPHEAKLNTSNIEFVLPIQPPGDYQQTKGNFAGNVSAQMTAADVPNGYHVEGSGDQGGCRGWSIHKPQFVGKNLMLIRAYCESGSSMHCTGGPINMCSVDVRLCYKIP